MTTIVQLRKYDPLDRITEAKETVNGTQTWIQNWGYDRYGNRSSFSQNIFGYTSVSNPTISSTTNRFTSGGITFDKNGNVTFDHNGYEYTYDGNNKQTQAILSTQKGGIGEGKRVKKTTHTSDNVIFVYANGKLVEERNASTNALQTSYIYAGSQLLATETSSATNYTVTDNLGSPRVLVNQSGTVVARRDFLPFGEELFADGTYRKSSDNYGTSGSDAVRQRFTGYQKDTETGLDFAEARMYQNQHGRFTAVDPLLASGKSANPQTFNRYVYTMNNPLQLVDPTGLQAATKLEPCTSGPGCGGWTQTERQRKARTVTATGSVVVDVSGSSEPVTSAASGIQMPSIGYGMEERMGRELEAMGQALIDAAKTAAYRAIPDSVEGGISLPFYSGGAQLSKDGNLFLGGNFTFGSDITNWLGDIKAGNKALYPKVGIGFGAKYFETNMTDETQRDNAISGAELEVQVLHTTLSKPLIGSGPRAIKFGKPGFGFGGTYTSQKLVDGSDVVDSLVNLLKPEE